ncbi:MAG: hypothetical protein AAFV43_04950 [Planctomycetota bacterium]
MDHSRRVGGAALHRCYSMDPLGPELAEIRSLAQRSQGLLEELRSKTSAQSDSRQADAERLGDEATQLIEQIAASIAGELASELAIQQNAQHTEAEQQLHTEREAWEQRRAEWESVRDQVESELSQRDQQLTERAAQLAAEAERLRTHADQEASVERERLLQDFADQQRLASEQLGGVQADLDACRAELAEAHAALDLSREQDDGQIELLEKFDIALADLQSHRERVAELEEQLAARPEPGAEQGAEVAQLRHERDELAERVAELEQNGGASPQGESGELDDLRARFELAVEDVRRLKNENAELEERLSQADGADTASDGNDWEAQKRRLLAQLEGEGDSASPERQEERATIAGTIQITDGVVAEKDHEIQRLRELVEEGSPGPDESAVDSAAAALLDDDEVIRAERERLASLEDQWQEKLRQAELELSLERAKIARTQNELAEQKLELETLRAVVERAAGESGGGESRQNWLNKLGLGGDQG